MRSQSVIELVVKDLIDKSEKLPLSIALAEQDCVKNVFDVVTNSFGYNHNEIDLYYKEGHKDVSYHFFTYMHRLWGKCKPEITLSRSFSVQIYLSGLTDRTLAEIGIHNTDLFIVPAEEAMTPAASDTTHTKDSQLLSITAGPSVKQFVNPYLSPGVHINQELEDLPVVDPSCYYVGLVNQAMTCYLNSLLQALYMTPEFRNALYNWEFDGQNETRSIPFQLQKLFLNLQVRDPYFCFLFIR